MKLLSALFLVVAASIIPARAQDDKSSQNAGATRPERLGNVAFSNSCSESVQASFNRGMALLHDFWYEEAQHQFEEIAKSDPACAMAHWGIAMSVFHQIWNRPSEASMTRGWSELEKAQSPAAKTQRERDYVAALRTFYQPAKEEFPARVDRYSTAMSKLYKQYPDDVDAGAFYALSLLACESPDDTSLAQERKALTVLTPLFAKYPDHPGVAHYIIHACDNPTLAAQGLVAAERYGNIAPSAAHSAHMPGHIFARLGLWKADIDANLASVAASEKALEDHHASIFDQLHADDFLLYAYLQSGEDARAKAMLEHTAALLTKSEAMTQVPGMDMTDMLPYYRNKFSVFYALEMRDWKSAVTLEPAPGASPIPKTLTYWARIIADGHLRRSKEAQADLAKYEDLYDQIRKGKHAYFADSTGAKVEQDEVAGWVGFAESNSEKALSKMRAAADLQDKVGQGEVDIPAREMLADMLLELDQPKEALVEYDLALKMSPNRFNGLFNAGRAAEAAGDKARAANYYSALLKSTNDGKRSERPEFAHVRSFLSATQVAAR